VTEPTGKMVEMTRSRVHRFGFGCAVAGFVCLMLVGCGGKESSKKGAGSSGANSNTFANIVLPEAPNFRLPPTRRTVSGHPESVLTVWGVLSEFNELGDEPVTVVGIVADLQVCAEENEMRCDLPTHLVLTHSDERNGFRLIVVGPQLKSLRLRMGQEEVFTGQLATLSPDGRIVAIDGLLLLDDLSESEDDAPRRKARRRSRRKAPSPIKTGIE